MLPKKGRKEITVDGILYHYMVRGYITVTARNSVTGEVQQYFEDVKPKWKIEMKPSDVAELIKNKMVWKKTTQLKTKKS